MKVHTSFDNAGDLTRAWRELLPPGVGPFPGPDWSDIWWRHFGQDGGLRILEIGPEPDCDRAVLPLMVTGGGEIRFIGNDELSDYAAPACSAAAYPRVAAELSAWLAETSDPWESARFEPIPADIGFAAQLAEAARAAGLKAETSETEVCPVLGLPPSFDEYLALLSGKQRHELRRKRRRFEDEAGEAWLRASTPQSAAADVELFLEWHRQAEGAKGHFMDDEHAGYFHDVALEGIDGGWAALEFLEAGGESHAATFSFADGDARYLYNSAFRPEARPLSPGIVKLALLIERSIDEGLAVFDFLRGSERYKFELGGVARPLLAVTIAPP